MKYSQEFEQQIKDTAAAQIVEIVGDYVELRRHGGGWIGCCPFHDEKTPSFNVSKGKGFYKCFGCGEGGDVIKFLMKINRWEYVEALEYLAGRFGMIDTGETAPRPAERPARKTERPAVQYVSNEILQETMRADKRGNTFFQFICSKFGGSEENRARVREVVKMYCLGVHGAAVTFPQIDTNGRCRYIKPMTYKADGHRDKTRPPYKIPRDLENYQQTLFGAHLLRGYAGKVAVVEAEKTAVIMAIVDREQRYLWLATGGSQNFEKKADILSGHDITIFPDSDEFEQWRKIAADKLACMCRVVRIEDTLHLLYKSNPEEYKNKDLADLVLKELPAVQIDVNEIINQ